jgi:glycosyltransferase involved in cell wall biosynthesis
MDRQISVVIPTYNYGRLVPEAVASVLGQTYPPAEVIVVDDGSTDDTPERLAPFLDRIRYIRQVNQGPSAARNTGIRAARGDWLAFLDSDDLWHPRKLEIQVRYLTEHPDVALLSTATTEDLAAGWAAVDPEGSLPATAVTLEGLLFASRFTPSTALVRRDCFERVGLFDPALGAAEDTEMWLRIASAFPVVRLELPLCWYRVHGASLSTAAARMEANDLKMLRKVFASVAALHGRPLLRLKAFSYAYYHATYRYSASRCWWTALGRFLRSFVLWPVPYQRAEVDRSLARLRMLVVLLLRMLHLVRPDSGPRQAAAVPLAAERGEGRAEIEAAPCNTV